jgi:hypothetical protein
MKISIRIKESMCSASREIFIFLYGSDGRARLLRPIKLDWEDLGNGACYFGDKEPSIKIPDELGRAGFVEALQEGLREAGLIAKQDELVGELRASKKHLEDMRTLALWGTRPTAPRDGGEK